MSAFQRVQELRQKKAEAVRSAQAVLDKAREQNRVLNADEAVAFEATHKTIEGLSGEIGRVERQREAEVSIGDLAPIDPDAAGTRPGNRLVAVHYTAAFAAFLLGTADSRDRLPQMARKAYDERGYAPGLTSFGMLPAGSRGTAAAEGRGRGFELMTSEQREEFFASVERRAAQGTALGVGGDFIPAGFVPKVESVLKAYGGMMESGAEILRTDSGNSLIFPTDNDVANKGAILAESTDFNEQNIATGQMVLDAFKYESKVVRIPIELTEDAAIDVESWAGEKVGIRIARILNEHFTNGTGAGQPRGAVVASALGATSALNTAVTHAELLTLEHSVDPAYRVQGGRFMFNDATLLKFKQQLDGNLRPLWQAGLADGIPDRIDGHPYTINQDMASIGASAKCVLFGSFRYYKIRLVRSLRVVVLRELFAKSDQIGIIAFMRADGDLIDTTAVKHLICPV